MEKDKEGKLKVEYAVLATNERLTDHPVLTCDSYREAERAVEAMKDAEKSYDLAPNYYRIYKRQVRLGKWEMVKRL